ncbi:MAG: 4Fe-4S binding protein [archaeon]
MVIRDIIKIDEGKCTGCGLCIPNCPEGALQVIDGKARLVSDLSCDGLGACVGHCPDGAISVERREAEPYDEAKVMENIIEAGPKTIRAHLEHLRDHGQKGYLGQALEVLKDKGMENPLRNPLETVNAGGACGCPGAKMVDFSNGDKSGPEEGSRHSQLRQWPVQMHLVSPNAPYYQEKDVLITADCVAYALADYHKDHLMGKGVAIACPKLDSGQEAYSEKIRALIDDAKAKTITVMTMEVPCCSGLLHIVKQASEGAARKVPIKSVVVGIRGNILSECWV